MRPFPHYRQAIPTTDRSSAGLGATLHFVLGAAVLVLGMLAAIVSMVGCAAVGSRFQPRPTSPSPTPTPTPTPTPPPSSIGVTVVPSSAGVLLGNSQRFAATVANSTDTGVTWSVNGVAGGTAMVGTITAAGVYTAPSNLPAKTGVQVTATSHADPPNWRPRR